MNGVLNKSEVFATKTISHATIVTVTATVWKLEDWIIKRKS